MSLITEGDGRFTINEDGMISTSEELGGDEVRILVLNSSISFQSYKFQIFIHSTKDEPLSFERIQSNN